MADVCCLLLAPFRLVFPSPVSSLWFLVAVELLLASRDRQPAVGMPRIYVSPVPLCPLTSVDVC